MKKKLFSTFFAILLLTFFPLPVIASPTEEAPIIETLADGSYFETIIVSEQSPFMMYQANKSVTKTKTTYYKDSKGTVKWSVSIKATFTYNGKSATCISCSHSTTHAKDWTIKSSSSKKSGNSATATAVACYSSYSISRSVTLTCSANGKVY